MSKIVGAYVVMAHVVMAYRVTVYMVVASTVMAYIVMANIVIAYVVTAYIVMEVYSDGLCSCDLLLDTPCTTSHDQTCQRMDNLRCRTAAV